MPLVLFLLCILGANLAVTYLEPIPVWPGIVAPAGVALVAFTLVLRDVVQRRYGVWGVVAALAGGIAASYALASPEIVTASVSAFVVSFLIDTAVFTAICRWVKHFRLAVLISGLVSLVPDTYVFLGMADLLQYRDGQLIGKVWGTALGVGLLVGYDWTVNRKS